MRDGCQLATHNMKWLALRYQGLNNRKQVYRRQSQFWTNHNWQLYWGLWYRQFYFFFFWIWCSVGESGSQRYIRFLHCFLEFFSSFSPNILKRQLWKCKLYKTSTQILENVSNGASLQIPTCHYSRWWSYPSPKVIIFYCRWA